MAKDVVSKSLALYMRLITASMDKESAEKINKALNQDVDELFTELIKGLAEQHGTKTLNAVVEFLAKPDDKKTNLEITLKTIITPEMMIKVGEELNNVPDVELEKGFSAIEQAFTTTMSGGQPPNIFAMIQQQTPKTNLPAPPAGT